MNKKLVKIVLLVLLSSAFGLLLAFPIKWCWNYTIPEIFDLPIINYGQAWCLNFLTSFFIQSSFSHSFAE